MMRGEVGGADRSEDTGAELGKQKDRTIGLFGYASPANLKLWVSVLPVHINFHWH